MDVPLVGRLLLEHRQGLRPFFLRHVLRTGALLEDEDFPIAERILRSFLKTHEPDRDALITGLRDELDARDTRLMLQDATAEY